MKIIASVALPRFRTVHLFTELSPCHSSRGAASMPVISTKLPTPVREGETSGTV